MKKAARLVHASFCHGAYARPQAHLTTEQHYFQRQTHGLDVRSTLDRYAEGK